MLVTETQAAEIKTVPREMITALDLLYTCSKPHFGLKIKMIKILRLMAILLTGQPYSLREAKIFIEDNWIFEKTPSYSINDLAEQENQS